MSEEINPSEEQQWIDDPQIALEVRSAILLAAATGIMEHLRAFEPAKHTRRYRELTDMAGRLNKLFDLYPLVWEYDIVSLGLEFFDKEHEERLNRMLKRGLKIIPPEAPGGLPKLAFGERWKRGHVLRLNGITLVIYSVHEEEYHFVLDHAIYYSSAYYPANPLLVKWKLIDDLGEDCRDEDIYRYLWIAGEKNDAKGK